MSSEAPHEENLDEEILDLHRAIVSLQEELDAVDWYRQRAGACDNDALKVILLHNKRNEAAALRILGFLSWLTLVQPINNYIAHVGSSAAAWARLRYEYGHLVGFLFALGGFAALLMSILAAPLRYNSTKSNRATGPASSTASSRWQPAPATPSARKSPSAGQDACSASLRRRLPAPGCGASCPNPCGRPQNRVPRCARFRNTCARRCSPSGFNRRVT